MDRLSDRENPPAQSNSYGCWDLQRAQCCTAPLASNVRASCSQDGELRRNIAWSILSKRRVAKKYGIAAENGSRRVFSFFYLFFLKKDDCPLESTSPGPGSVLSCWSPLTRRAKETQGTAAASSSECCTIALADTSWVGFKEVEWRESVQEREAPTRPRRPEDEWKIEAVSFQNRPLHLAEPTIKVDNWEVKERDQ